VEVRRRNRLGSKIGGLQIPFIVPGLGLRVISASSDSFQCRFSVGYRVSLRLSSLGFKWGGKRVFPL
jgi:hypothetical protein